jgi:uncharacterized membrane protein YedE/YeeE
MDSIPNHLLVALLGGLGGVLLGYIARSLRFCTLSAIENAAFGGDFTQARMWILAIAVAILGTQGLHLFGLLHLQESFHWSSEINWLGASLGGLIFGLGMAAVGNCSFGSLLRVGGGDLRALVDMLIIGIVGSMTMRGLTGLFREHVIEETSIHLPDGLIQDLPGLLSGLLQLPQTPTRVVLTLLIAGLCLAWCLRDPSFRAQGKALAGGLMVGLIVLFGWITTGVIGADPFEPVALGSYTFIRPVGDTLIYLMLFSGSSITFGVGTVLGTLAGAAVAALKSGEANWEGFDDLREMRRHICGAAAMGFGGVVAMGCTIGQGVSGVGTLALTSFIALGCIWLGGVIGVRLLVYGGVAPIFFGRQPR